MATASQQTEEFEFVQHVKKPEWGIGRVLERNEPAKRVHVFFEHHGRKVLRSDIGMLEDVDAGGIGENSLLRNLSEAAATGNYTKPPRSFGDLLATFNEKFPNGFDDPTFIEGDRAYKEDIRQYAREQLDPELLQQKLDAGDFTQMFKDSRKVVSKTNTAFHIDQSKFGAVPAEAHEAFCRALVDLLHGGDSYDDRFTRFVAVLEPHGAAKWPSATYFSFIYEPEHHYLVKPNVIRPAAETLSFDLAYDAKPNSNTYGQVRRFCRYVKSRLEDVSLRPRDMVDVQTFLWYATGQADKHSRSSSS